MSVSVEEIQNARMINLPDEVLNRWSLFPMQDGNCEFGGGDGNGNGDDGEGGGVYIDETGMEHQAYLKMEPAAGIGDDQEEVNVPADDIGNRDAIAIKNEDLQPCWRVLLDLIGQEGAPRNKWIEVADLAADEKTQTGLGLKKNTATQISNQVMMLAQQTEEPDGAVWTWIARKQGMVILRVVGDTWYGYGDFTSTRDRTVLLSPGQRWGQKVGSPDELQLPSGEIRVEMSAGDEATLKSRVMSVYKVAQVKKLWEEQFPDNPAPKDYKKVDYCRGLAYLTPAFTL